LKSIVIPVFNEEEMILQMYEELVPFLNNEDEVLFINDGSTDTTVNEIKSLIEKDRRLKLINFSRNFGHQPAITAGLQYSEGDVVIIMDCDLQDPPELIPALLKKWKEGYDVVHCIRKKRKESLFKRVSYKLFYWLYTRLSDFETLMDSGDFSLMSRRVVNEINKMEENAKFIRGLNLFVGFRHTAIEYERPGRFKGETKYSLIKLVKLALDGIFSFTTFPLRIMSFLGFCLLLSSFIMILVLVYYKLSYKLLLGHTMTYVLILFFGGINLFCFGIIGEYIGKIFYETKNRPFYIVESFVNMGVNGKDG
jgi:dolichol-phosphate mannosyltransferase